MAWGWAVPGYGEVRELGSGASGTVVLARDEASGHPVAIKYLSDDLRGREGFLADFRAEAEVVASIDDPHVVRLYEYVQDAGGAAIVMQLVDGVTLRRMLVEQGPTRPESALSVLRGSLLGLGAAHERGIVHRDYKPENVMVTREGDSLLTDFGLAVAGGGAVLSAGTPTYMAPELWADGEASPRGDIYAATAGFVECLTGRPPYGSQDPEMLRRQHERAAIPVDSVPEPVRDLVSRGLAKDPAGRPADAAAFLVELEAAAVAGYGEGWEERGRRRLAERAALLALLFPLAVGALGGSAVASTVLGGAASAPPSRARTRALLGAAAAAVVIGGSIVVATTGGTGTVVQARTGATPGGLPSAVGVAPAIAPGFPPPTGAAFPLVFGRTGVPTSGGGSSSAGDGRRDDGGGGGGGSAARRSGGSDGGGEGGDSGRTGSRETDPDVPSGGGPVIVDPPVPPPPPATAVNPCGSDAEPRAYFPEDGSPISIDCYNELNHRANDQAGDLCHSVGYVPVRVTATSEYSCARGPDAADYLPFRPDDPDNTEDGPRPVCGAGTVLVRTYGSDLLCTTTTPLPDEGGCQAPYVGDAYGSYCYLDPDQGPPVGGRQTLAVSVPLPSTEPVPQAPVQESEQPPQEEPPQEEPQQEEPQQEEPQQEEPQQEEPQQEEPQQEEESDEPDSGGQADDASDQGSEAGESTKADDSSDASESTSAKCEPSECGS